jgi:hypothetical protein
MKSVHAMLVLLTMSTVALAQTTPTPPPAEAPGGGRGGGPGGGGPPPGRRDDGGGPGPRGGGGAMRPPGGPGMGGPGAMGGPGLEGRNERIEQMRNYLAVMDAFSRQSRDASQAGIAAVIAAADILKPRGTDAGIEYFTKMLPQVKNPAVQRAVRVQLAELYKAAGKQDQALEQLRELIVAEPSTADLKALENPPPPPRPNP